MKSDSLAFGIVAAIALSSAIPMISAAQTTDSYTYSYSGRALPIFSDDANIVTLAYVTVPRSTKIQKVTATVDIDYPQVGDLKIFLYSPAGTRTKLVEHDCGSQGTLRRITFDDSAPNKYKDYCPAEPGWTVRAEEPLSNSSGENGVGVWVLAVENDESDSRNGWILGYSLTITGEVYSLPTTASELIVNAASLQGGGVAPGELISIYGTNLGPQTPVAAEPGNLPTLLGGTEVMFNEQKGYIRYASKYRVDVQVPYALGVPGDLWVTVMREGSQSSPVNVLVVSAKPGLFTLNQSGLGQIDAVNADGTLNRNEPARRGTEITVYASGLGYTLPPVPAGQLPMLNPTPGVYYPVSASVAGVQATVTSARLAQDRPGVYEVKILIPEFVPVGPVEVKIASVSESSQNGAFVRVR
jgi:uncharacterized protein (TIGR03437 family)